MPERAAIVTGASRGIGFAIAEMLAEEGYALTLAARKPEGLEAAAEQLRGTGAQVTTVAVNMAEEDAPATIVEHHRQAYGRLDVLVNSAGIGIGAAVTGHETRHVDRQLQINVRSIVLFYREAAELLRAAGAEHRSAWVINLASLAGKAGQPWLSVYGATKAAVISYTQSMNEELAGDGVKSCALCPGYVDTDMAAHVKERIGAENILSTSDISEAVRYLLHVSPVCLIPEIVFRHPGDTEPTA